MKLAQLSPRSCPHNLKETYETRELAQNYQLPLCDLQAHFTSRFKKRPNLIDSLILPDGVHLTDVGNKVAALHLASHIADILTK